MSLRSSAVSSGSIAASIALLLGACASQPQPQPVSQMVYDAAGTAYPSNVKVWCNWPTTAPVQIMAHDCAVGGGTIGAVATSDSSPNPLAGAGTPISLTSKQQQAVRAGVAKGMKDPESARFEDKMAGAKKADGTITVFDVPGGGTGPYQGTYPTGINDAGTAEGFDIDSSNVNHGFLRAADGTIIATVSPIRRRAASI